MSFDLELDDGQQAVAAAVAAFCDERFGDDAARRLDGEFPLALWRELAELGVLGVATPEAEGGALELVAAVESLGRAAFPGPLAGTFLATQVLGEALRGPVAAGELVVSAGVPPLMPFAPCADVFLEIDGSRVFRARPAGAVEAVAVLGGEPWGRLELVREEELSGAARGLLLAQLAVATQLAAMGRKLVDDAAQHAADRKQFGAPIATFQAVAHPLADSAIELSAAATLARAAAFEFDRAGDGEARGAERAGFLAASAWMSASRAAVSASYLCHQVFGAVGITLEGPAFHLSRRIRQLASQPPGAGPARARVLREVGLAGGLPA